MAQTSDVGIACEKKGSEFSMYLNLGNDCSTPVWTFHKGIIGDLTITETEDEEERLIRDPSQKVKEFITDRINLEISGTQIVNQLYEGCAFLNSARVGGEAVDVLVLDGPITEVGAAGWRGRWINPERTKEGPQTGGATQNFRLKPAACQVAACKVRPVIVDEADSIDEYDPEVFTPTVIPS
jgi:hypothetical protein